MPALLSESITRSRLPTLRASACVFSSCACPSVMANSPSKAITLGAVDARADDVPERRLPGGGGDADAGRTAVDVIGDVSALGMSGEGPDSAQLCLGEQRMIGKAVVLQQRRHRAGATPEAERVDRQHRNLGIGVVAPVAGRLVSPRHRLAHQHPERIARRECSGRRRA